MLKKSVIVDKLTHQYEATLAVDHISFKIEPGKIFGLIGPNGAGKSTTIKMLTTLLPITSGIATIDGFDVEKDPSNVRQSIGYVPQQPSADGELTGYENLSLTSKLYGISPGYRKDRIQEVLKFMNLTDMQDKLVKTYSGGMMRRLEIGQAILHNPCVLFLDEPAAGLDPAARVSLWNHIQDLNKRLGTSILMTTHDMDEADALCDMIALMYKGKIIVMDHPKNLKANLEAEIGRTATLDDVFIHHTGSFLKP